MARNSILIIARGERTMLASGPLDLGASQLPQLPQIDFVPNGT